MKIVVPNNPHGLTPPHVEAMLRTVSNEVTRDAQIAQAQAAQAQLDAQNIESQGRVSPVPTRGRGDDTQ